MDLTRKTWPVVVCAAALAVVVTPSRSLAQAGLLPPEDASVVCGYAYDGDVTSGIDYLRTQGYELADVIDDIGCSFGKSGSPTTLLGYLVSAHAVQGLRDLRAALVAREGEAAFHARLNKRVPWQSSHPVCPLGMSALLRGDQREDVVGDVYRLLEGWGATINCDGQDLTAVTILDADGDTFCSLIHVEGLGEGLQWLANKGVEGINIPWERLICGVYGNTLIGYLINSVDVPNLFRLQIHFEELGEPERFTRLIDTKAWVNSVDEYCPLTHARFLLRNNPSDNRLVRIEELLKGWGAVEDCAYRRDAPRE